MSDSATLEKVVNEIIIDKGWDKEFIKKGEELGIKKGEELGLKKGEELLKKSKMETARKLLLKGFNIEEVIELTDLTIDQVKELQQSL